jgi:hypothetical protein
MRSWLLNRPCRPPSPKPPDDEAHDAPDHEQSAQAWHPEREHETGHGEVVRAVRARPHVGHDSAPARFATQHVAIDTPGPSAYTRAEDLSG